MFEDLHKVIAMMADDFDQFCQANDITYYLMGGTALGAMRHHGFIPWDDDFDVFMDLRNYRRFLATAKTELDTGKYYLQRENTKEWPLLFSKIRLNGTIYHEKDSIDRDMHQGIYIDIMCLNNAFSHPVLRRIQHLCGRFLSANALARRGYITSSPMKKLILTAAKLTCVGPIKWTLLKIARGFSDESKMVGHFFGRAPFKATSFPRAWLSTPRYVPFESIKLPVPNNVEQYLSTRFGPKYMQPPSENVKAAYPSHAVHISLGRWQE